MKIFGARLRRIVFSSVATLSILLFSVAPLSASAAEITARTTQLVPPSTTSTCPAVQASDFKVYMYDDAVNSFDVSVSDATYVAIAGSVGDSFIPFNFMSRSVDANGTLRMHIDTPSLPVSGTAPVTLTLLSVQGVNHIVCALTLTTSVVGNAPVYVSSTSGGNSSGSSSNSAAKETIAPSASATSSVAEMVTASSGVPAALAKTCSTKNGATRLWTVLLAIYLLIVAATVLAQPTAKPTDKMAVLLGAAIAIPLVVLLAVWGYAPGCRIGMWAPLAALLIAGVGFLLGFRSSTPMPSTAVMVPPSVPKSPTVPPQKTQQPPQKTPPTQK